MTDKNIATELDLTARLFSTVVTLGVKKQDTAEGMLAFAQPLYICLDALEHTMRSSGFREKPAVVKIIPFLSAAQNSGVVTVEDVEELSRTFLGEQHHLIASYFFHQYNNSRPAECIRRARDVVEVLGGESPSIKKMVAGVLMAIDFRALSVGAHQEFLDRIEFIESTLDSISYHSMLEEDREEVAKAILMADLLIPFGRYSPPNIA